jgi:aspartyl-tRNA(Asn)/glutamyl-tRNA(Gln) amidotransferase subunit C
MQLTADEVKHIAKLARLELSEVEVTRYQDQLGAVLKYIASLREVDTSAVSPTAQVTGVMNVMEVDAVSPSLPAEAWLPGAPARERNRLKVKSVFGKGS